MRGILPLACALVAMPALGAPAASVQASAAPAAAQAAIPDNAMRLSMLLNPADKALDIGMRGFRTGIDLALKRNPDDASVYDQNPGLLQAIIDASGPVLRKHLIATIPVAQTRYAAFYAEKFSAQEIDELIAFYSTPTGAKVIDAMYAGIDLAKLSEGVDKEGNLHLTPEAVAEANSELEAKLPDKFDADDWKEIFMFGATPTHAKLMRVIPEFNQLAARLQNEPDPALDAELNETVTATVKTYMANKKDSPPR